MLKHDSTCAQCGATFRPHTTASKYCSLKCASKARSTLVERACEHCGATFRVKPSQIEQGRGRYCSKKCAYLARRTLADATCIVCGRTFRPYTASSPSRFCSNACQGEHFRSLPAEQRESIMAPAHAAVRGKKQSDEHRQKIARTIQARCRLSDDESEILSAYHAAGLHPVPLYAVHRYNIDFAFPNVMLAVEYNGGNWHESPKKREIDQRKAEYLIAHGWRILTLSRIAGPDGVRAIVEQTCAALA